MKVQCSCIRCGKVMFRYPSRIFGTIYCSFTCRDTKPRSPDLVSDDGQVVSIPLYSSDGSVRAYTLVDAEDAKSVGQWRWNMTVDGYAHRSQYCGPAVSPKAFLLHRELMGCTPGDGIEVDHKNRDRLDNRRENLRTADRLINGQNLPGRKGSSQYRGVSWAAWAGKWRAKIVVQRKTLHVGYFETEEEAAEQARLARLRLMVGALD